MDSNISHQIDHTATEPRRREQYCPGGTSTEPRRHERLGKTIEPNSFYRFSFAPLVSEVDMTITAYISPDLSERDAAEQVRRDATSLTATVCETRENDMKQVLQLNFNMSFFLGIADVGQCSQAQPA